MSPSHLHNSQWQFQVEQPSVPSALLLPRAAAPVVPARTGGHGLKENPVGLLGGISGWLGWKMTAPRGAECLSCASGSLLTAPAVQTGLPDASAFLPLA